MAFSRAQFRNFTRELEVATRGLSGPEASRRLATTARKHIATVERRQSARSGGVMPDHLTIVDGRQGAAPESVKPDGVILIQWHYLTEAVIRTVNHLITNGPERSGAWQDSITTYGRREAEESVESITDLTSAQNWARGYFGINALPITPHVIEIAGADDADIEPDGKLELLGQDVIESAQVVRVAYSIGGDGLLTASIDLNTERPTFEGLLTRMQKEAARKATGTTASGGNSATGGGGGSAGHSRLHAVDSADDHEAAEAADYGKVLRADRATGALDWVDTLDGLAGALVNVVNVTTTDDTIVETYASGLVATTTFSSDGSVTTAYGAPVNKTITTIFNADGSITETVV